MSSTSLAVDSPQGKKIFVFDRVFAEDVGQEGVWDYLQESVAAFVQGYNVSLLAYGQSGAGKSYTMGTASPGDQPNQSSHGMFENLVLSQGGNSILTTATGIIPRAAAALFEHLGASMGTQRAPGSGLRAPSSRLSQFGMPKPLSNKNWTIRATYVEVSGLICALYSQGIS